MTIVTFKGNISIRCWLDFSRCIMWCLCLQPSTSKLISIKLSSDTYNGDDVHCKYIQHCQDIDYLWLSFINYCLKSIVLAIPFVRSGNGDIPG